MGDNIWASTETRINEWDKFVDVAIVGGGCAGMSAGIESAHWGAHVLLIEGTADMGGTSALSGGEIYLGGGTSVQESCGFSDSPEEMYKFLEVALGPNSNGEKIWAYCSDSVRNFEWLRNIGVPFKPSLWEGPAYVPPTDDGLMWLGEDSSPYRDIATPAPRGHRPQAGHFGGTELTSHLAMTVRRSCESLTDARVERLVVSESGQVVGVVATQYGKEIAVRAGQGVVIASGGFIYNESMLRSHAPVLMGHPKLGTPRDDGHGIVMAQAVGAAVERMDIGEAALWVSPPLLYRSMLVNRRAQRFVNEDTYPGRVGQEALFHQGGECYMILDQDLYESVPAKARMGQYPTWVSSDIRELEWEVGFPKGSLGSSIALYNEYARAGSDEMFGKRPEWLTPLNPPYGIVDARGRQDGSGIARMGVAQGGFLVFTLGGLSTDTDGAVLDLTGMAIPGLFAAGRVSSGMSGFGYISGTSLGEGICFGRRAGRAVVGGMY